ncbi:FAD-dependent oxidoreductase [Nocardia tengchongensis]|uniref:FAD-dependent oxidoreductase n=1 Tax=Nocardia tengchongensis TaxID=2055889 RepID=UPI00369C8E0B
MSERVVIIGGDAAGMAAASQARRLKSAGELEIVVFERGHFTSYSACGIPYWVGGDVDGPDALIARTPAEHRARDIDLRLRTEVVEIDVAGRRVRFRGLDTGLEGWIGYDKLVIATGATPIRPLRAPPPPRARAPPPAAAAVDSEGDVWPVVVDATLGGGDVALRGCDTAAPVSSLQKWLGTADPGSASSVGACSGQTSTGVRVLARTPDPLPRRESLFSVARHLETAGLLGVFDAGAPVTSRLAAPLLSDPRVGLVITVAARPDAINRLQPALAWLDENFSEFVVGDAVIVLTEQVPGAAATVIDHVRTHLGSWVRAVVQIPFDLHLATGGPISWHRLTAETRDAYLTLLGALR